MIECIPNISEGRDQRSIDEIENAISSVPGVTVLHRDVGPDAHRTVFTFVGDGQGVCQAVLKMYEAALKRIDLRLHMGPHTRIGSVDVCPFVPLAEGTGVTSLVEETAAEVADRFTVPVFLYEKSARFEERRRLFEIRRGEFEGLADKLASPNWKPDFGPSTPHPSFGATVLGHRDFLVAFNVSLDTTELSIARGVARDIRELRAAAKDTPDKWKAVRAIAWSMPSYGCTQVSMNVVDIEKISLVECFNEVTRFAEVRGVKVLGSELVGLIPQRMLLSCAKDLGLSGEFDEVASRVINYLGLRRHKEFSLSERVLESALASRV
jgi:glutamate formiminotransferase / formiminotetrahydrofolate cyclodeaminase